MSRWTCSSRRGLDMRYDPEALELQVEPKVDQTLPQAISFAPKAEKDSASLEKPAYASVYLNMRMVASYVSQSSSGSTGVEAPSYRFRRRGPDRRLRVRKRGHVLHRRRQGLRPAAISRAMSSTGAARGSSTTCRTTSSASGRATFSPDFSGFQTSTDLLGVTATKSYAQLQPGKSIRPTGARSFRLDGHQPWTSSLAKRSFAA